MRGTGEAGVEGQDWLVRNVYIWTYSLGVEVCIMKIYARGICGVKSGIIGHRAEISQKASIVFRASRN